MNTNFRKKLFVEFNKLGITKEHAELYLKLWSGGPHSVVQLSKQLSMGRNKLYRLLDDLQDLNLVTQVKKQFGSEFEALHYRNLQLVVDKRKGAFFEAQKGLESLFKKLPHLKTANAVSSKVIHYHGMDGLKQVNWNLVHAKGMYRVYEVSRLTSYLDEEFAENLRREWFKRKIYTRDLTNDTVVESHTDIVEFTEKLSEYRYISPEVLKIKTEIYIYNDVVAVLEYDNLKFDPNSIFCVEIYNKALAEVQQQVYDILWEQSEPLKIVKGARGKRTL